MPFAPKRDLISGLERQERVGAQVTQKPLRDLRGNAEQVVDRALQKRAVRAAHAGATIRVRARSSLEGRGQSEPGRRPRAAAESNRRCYVLAAWLSALVHMTVEANVRAQSEDMIAVHDGQIVHGLRRRHEAGRARSVVIWLADAREIEWRDVRESFVGFALGEDEDEAREAHSQ